MDEQVKFRFSVLLSTQFVYIVKVKIFIKFISGEKRSKIMLSCEFVDNMRKQLLFGES